MLVFKNAERSATRKQRESGEKSGEKSDEKAVRSAARKAARLATRKRRDQRRALLCNLSITEIHSEDGASTVKIAHLGANIKSWTDH